MASLSGMAGVIPQVESPYITVHQERCCLVRNRNADCLKCASVCTSGCIDFHDGILSVHPEKCIGCGTCATVCPTCCLEAHHPNDADFHNACQTALAATKGTVYIACGAVLDSLKGAYDHDAVVRVECLGRVEESMLTSLVADGATSIVAVHGDCTNCEHVKGWEVFEQVLYTEDQLLGAWGADPAVISIADGLPQELVHQVDNTNIEIDNNQDRLSPEEFIEQTTPSKPHYVKVMADGTLPHFVPDRRERLLDALAMIGEPKAATLSTRLWGHVVINRDKCTACRMCATFCPTGAITKFDEEDGTFGIIHHPGDCVKCGTCQAICLSGSLELRDEVSTVEIMEGTEDRYEMNAPLVQRGNAHTMWQMAKLFTGIDQVYER